MATPSGKAKNKGKSNTQREKGQEELLEAARKRVECERRAMKIIERLLEESISESFFEDCGKFITSKQFEDVAVERAIEKLCGYPLCDNKLTNIPRQQYHISLKSKKVFDITERKNFCSQRCFQAYKYYQTQLTDEPLWTRDYKRMPPIKLFEHDTNAAAEARLKPQNEIPMKQEIKVPAVNTVSEPTTEGTSREENKLRTGFGKLSLDKSSGDGDGEGIDKDRRREEMLRRIAESVMRPGQGEQRRTVADSGSHVESMNPVDELALSPSVDREQEDVRHTLTPEGQHSSGISQGNLVETSSDSEVVSEHLAMPGNENLHGYGMQQLNKVELVQTGSGESKKCTNMKPVISLEESKKKDNLRDLTLQPDNHDTTVKTEESLKNVQQQTISSKDMCDEKKTKRKKKKTPVAENPMLVILQHIQKCLLEWKSEETMNYIYGSSKPAAGNQSSTDEAGHDEHDRELKVRAVQEFEQQVGDRLDREELQEGAFPAPCKPLPDYNRLRREEEEKYALKVKEFFMGREMTSSVPEVEEKPNKPPDGPVDRTEALPPVDSRAQVTIRRKILLERLGKILPGIAVSLQLSVHEVNPMITSLVRTFHPGSHNIVFKPVAWTVLTVVLIHILAEKETSIRESLESDHSVAFLTSMFNQLGLRVDVINGIIKNFKQGVPH